MLNRYMEVNVDRGMRRYAPAIASLQDELISKIPPYHGRLIDKDSTSTFWNGKGHVLLW